MFVYGKHIVNSIKKKPTQPLIIIITIAMAVAIFLASFVVKNVFTDYSVAKYKSSAGDSDISINVSSQSEVRFMELSKAEELLDDGDKAYGVYTITSIYNDGIKNYTANIYATDLNEVNEFQSFKLISSAGVNLSQINNRIIVSENFASTHHLELNQEVYLKIMNRNKRYEVAGIAENTGLFFNHDVLAHDEGVITILWQELGLGFVYSPIYNKILIKLENKTFVDEKMTLFKDSAYFADKEIKLSDRGTDTVLLGAQEKLLIVIALLVGVLSTVIIYSSIILMMSHRVDSMAIFKSVGATKLQMNWLLFLELLIYGVIGSLIGFLFSNIILDVLTKILNIEGILLKSVPIYYFYSFVFGIVLVICSGLFQIIKTTNKSLKQLLMGFRKTYSLMNWKILLVMCCLFVGSYILMYFIPIAYVLYYNMYLFISAFFLLMVLLPYLFILIYKIVEKIFSNYGKNGLIKIVSRSNRRNKSVLNTNILFTFSIILMMLITFFIGVINTEIKRLENAYMGDLHIENISDPENTTYNHVIQTLGVESAHKYLIVSNCVFFEKDDIDLIGLNPLDLDNIINSKTVNLSQKDFSGNEIIVPQGYLMRNNLKIGDQVKIEVGRNQIDFIIKGSFDAPLTYFIADINFLNIGYNGLSIDISDGNEEETYQQLIMDFNNKPYIFFTSSDLAHYFQNSLDSFVKLFSSFLIIVITIVIIGFINNSIISLQERKDELQTMRQNGMTKGQFFKMISLESGFNVLGCVSLGVVFAICLVKIAVFATKPMGIYFTIKLDSKLFLIVFLLGLIVYMVINLLIAYFYLIIKDNQSHKYNRFFVFF